MVKRLEAAVTIRESNILGISTVFLNGNRGDLNDPITVDGVRTQETNLGDLTADANLWYAKLGDPTVTVSIKNGGGTRNSIGITSVPVNSTSFVRVPNEELKFANGTVLKLAGGISQNVIASALAFNNILTLVTVTKTELKAILEYGISGLRGPQGRMCQVGGVQFTFNSLASANTFRLVTLDFLLGGGDGYTFPTNGRLDITGDDPGKSSFAFTGSEHDAMAEFLLPFHNSTNPYSQADTDRLGDVCMLDATFIPTKAPTKAPTDIPSQSPSVRPVNAPVKVPTLGCTIASCSSGAGACTCC